MGYKLNSTLAAIIFTVFYFFQKQWRRDAIARQRGCEPPIKHRPVDPIFGVDFQMGMYGDIPSLYRLHQRYRNSFQVSLVLGTPTINTIAPENVQTINTAGTDWGIQPMRLAGMEYFCGRGFLTMDGDMWQHSRKLLKLTFAKNNLIDLSIVSRETDKLLDHLSKDGATVDLQPLLYVMFLHTSLHFLVGIDPRNQLDDAPYASQAFVGAFHDALFYTMFRVILGPLFKLVPQAKYLKACETAHRYLDHYVDRAVSDPASSSPPESGPKRSVIQGLSSQTDDKAFIRSQILQGMMASQETTSALLGNAFFLLARHPVQWQRVRTEVLQKGDSLLSFNALLGSKVLQNVLLESLRLYPVFPVMARIALNDTTLPTGGGPNHDSPIFVPKGSMGVMSYFALHRNSVVFGDDVEAFKPERWNTINPGQWEFMGFGGGNRACLGQQKALVESAYVLARLAMQFQRLECRDHREWKGELKLTCKSANGCKVAFYY